MLRVNSHSTACQRKSRPHTGAFSRQAFLSLLTVYLVSSAHLQLNKRSPTKESVEDLKTRTSGLKLDAELLKDYLKEQYHISDKRAKHLDSLHWLNQTDMIISETVAKEATSEPKEALKFHYYLLSVYGLYVKELLTNGTLALKKSEEETREKLNDFEIKLSSCMFSLKMALQSSGSDVNSNVTNGILDPIFMASSSPLKNAVFRAYITMQDGIDLMEFLNTIYQNIDVSSSNML